MLKFCAHGCRFDLITLYQINRNFQSFEFLVQDITRHTKFAGWQGFENHSTKYELWLSHCYRDSLCCLLQDAPTLMSRFLPYPSLAMARHVYSSADLCL